MTVFPSQVTDLAAPVSQDPAEVVVDTTGTGVAAGKATGQSGTPDVDDTGGSDVPHFGIAGSYAGFDDAAYVDPEDNTVGDDSAQFPGQRYSNGYLNEKAVEFDHVTEGNLIVQDRPVGVSADVDLVN